MLSCTQSHVQAHMHSHIHIHYKSQFRILLIKKNVWQSNRIYISDIEGMVPLAYMDPHTQLLVI
jgi:hypothetical protein